MSAHGKFLDRPLIHANLSQSHSVPSLPLRGLLNRKRSAECWTRASALAGWLEETEEYRSYILIDFNKASQEVKSLFNDLMDLDFIFLRLQQIYSKILYDRQSVLHQIVDTGHLM